MSQVLYTKGFQVVWEVRVDECWLHHLGWEHLQSYQVVYPMIGKLRTIVSSKSTPGEKRPRTVVPIQ